MKLRFQRITVILLAVLPALFFTGCGGGRQGGNPGAGPVEGPGLAAAREPPPAATPTAANEVVIDNFAFNPPTLTVAAGTRVTWVNRVDVPHTATSSAKPRLFHSGTLDTDDHFAHVFTSPGTYEYFCAVHPHMTGRVIVK